MHAAARNRVLSAAAALLPGLLAIGGCVSPAPSSPPAPPAARHAGASASPAAAPDAFLARGAEAMRRCGHRVERASGGVVRSRPRPVPSALEPWRAGARADPGLAAAATLGELREVAVLRAGSGGGGAAAEVWLERAHRPARRLVIRSDGAVFREADAQGGPRRPDPADDPLAAPFGEDGPFSPAARAGRDDPAGVAGDPGDPGDGPLFGTRDAANAEAEGAPPRAGGGLRWDRWRRLPAAEAELLGAWEAAGG